MPWHNGQFSYGWYYIEGLMDFYHVLREYATYNPGSGAGVVTYDLLAAIDEAGLTVRQREVLLHRLQEKSYMEIGLELGISDAAVCKHMDGAMRGIKEYLNGG